MASYEELTDEQLLVLPTHRLFNIYKLYRELNLWISGNSHYGEYYDDTALAARHQMIQKSVNL